MGLKRQYKISTNGEATMVRKHAMKWLSGITKKMKKERGLPYMLAPRKCCLDYSKVYSNVTEDTNTEISIGVPCIRP